MAVLALSTGLLFAYWGLRPNGSIIDPSLGIETWTAVGDGMHNSNTDLIFWREQFYLIHASSPWHFGSKKCKLVLWRSADAHSWDRVTEFKFPGQDIRDPKFAAIGGRLMLYVLRNVAFNPEPNGTAVMYSEDGVQWTEPTEIEPKGWLFWRPKTRDGVTWYVPAYWYEHGKSILLSSTDGIAWKQVSIIHEGDRNDETDIEFLPDGRMRATARLEISDNLFGDLDACTLIAESAPPYAEWKSVRCRVTRLDGPCLFPYDGAVYAVGRHNPDGDRFLNHYGGILGRKRTSLYKVEEDRLVHLSDLPSAGDTSYAGCVIRGDDLFISYYTSRIDRDYPWILGMLCPSEIRIARVSLTKMNDVHRGEP